MPDAPTIPGPNPDTTPPAFVLPAGACDTHCHIFGPADRYPYAAGRSYTPPDAPLAAFAALHARLGVGRAVIVNASAHGTDHRPVVDAIAQSGGRYRGIVSLEPGVTDGELAALDAAGIDGCRFTFLKRLGRTMELADFRRLAERVAPLGWHVDLYLDPGTAAEFAPALRALPLPYVIDHMGTVAAAGGVGQPEFVAVLELLRADEKCWVKVTGLERASSGEAPFADALPFAAALCRAAPDRVLWGTDWPHPNVRRMPNDKDLVDAIPAYAPDPAVQAKLLVENPSRLFRWGR